MNNQVCYNESYDQIRRKQYLINRGKFLLKSDCCNYNSCDKLLNDIQKTKNVCNDLFANNFNDVDEKGNIKDSLCSELLNKQREIMNKSFTYKQNGGKYKRSKYKRSKCKRAKTKKYRKLNK